MADREGRQTAMSTVLPQCGRLRWNSGLMASAGTAQATVAFWGVNHQMKDLSSLLFLSPSSLHFISLSLHLCSRFLSSFIKFSPCLLQGHRLMAIDLTKQEKINKGYSNNVLYSRLPHNRHIRTLQRMSESTFHRGRPTSSASVFPPHLCSSVLQTGCSWQQK